MRDAGELLAELDHAAAGTRSYCLAPSKLVLIDTGAEVDDRAHVALRAAHLVLVPFRSLEGPSGPARRSRPRCPRT